MTYELKAGEFVKDGVLHGWTGKACVTCNGCGEDNDARACRNCAGTGEEYGVMPTQPLDLPADTE